MEKKSKRGGGNRIAYENGLQQYVKSIRLLNEEVFIENSTYARHHIKKRIIEEKMVKYECSLCDNKGEWMGKKLPLVLDHINGINNDNRIENQSISSNHSKNSKQNERSLATKLGQHFCNLLIYNAHGQ